MIIVETVSLDVLQANEKFTDANIRLGGYDMDKVCPNEDFRILRVLLQDSDLDRLFVLGMYHEVTKDGSCLLKDTLPVALSKDRVASFKRDNIDLRTSSQLAPLMVARTEKGPLTLYDGNNRMLWQRLTHGSIEGIAAFVSIHPKINLWKYIPSQAKR